VIELNWDGGKEDPTVRKALTVATSCWPGNLATARASVVPRDFLGALHFSHSIPALKGRGHIDRMLIGAVSVYINSPFQGTFGEKGD
jgi:hypothetical protein